MTTTPHPTVQPLKRKRYPFSDGHFSANKQLRILKTVFAEAIAKAAGHKDIMWMSPGRSQIGLHGSSASLVFQLSRGGSGFSVRISEQHHFKRKRGHAFISCSGMMVPDSVHKTDLETMLAAYKPQLDAWFASVTAPKLAAA
jgi:hypothetical protein